MKVFWNSISFMVRWRRFPVPSSESSVTRTRRWIPVMFLEDVLTEFADWTQRTCLSQRSEETTKLTQVFSGIGLCKLQQNRHQVFTKTWRLPFLPFLNRMAPILI